MLDEALEGRLFDLVTDLCDGTIATAEFAEFEQLLSDDPTALWAYVRFMDQHGYLLSYASLGVAGISRPQIEADRLAAELLGLDDQFMTNGPSSEPPVLTGPDAAELGSAVQAIAQEATPGSHPAGSESPVLGFLGAAMHLSATWLSSPKVLALSVMGGLATYFVGLMISIAISRAYWGERTPKDQAEALAGAPARIVAASGCRWQDRAARADLGGKLPAGVSRLTEGIVELEFDGGARVCVEGPAEFAARSGQRMELVRGRLVAYVPKQARGFTVDTPSVEVIDLGTEFGVEVDGQGSTDLHVIRGQVEVKPASKPLDGQPRGQRVVAGRTVRVSAGEAIRVSASNAAPERISLDTARFDAVRASAAAEASNDQRPARAFTEGRPIWLGNLFDDKPHTSLAEAMRTDTFKASPTFNNTLGVDRVIYGGDPIQEIAPGMRFDLTNLGWEGAPPLRIANDAWTDDPICVRNNVPAGGIRLEGKPMTEAEPRIEEGIGTHANSLLTFSLVEIREAGKLAGQRMQFVCDRVGVNDGALPQTIGGCSVHMAVLISTRTAIRAALVDGVAADIAKQEGHWLISSPIGEPLRAGMRPFAVHELIDSNDEYLTLICTGAGDGIHKDHGVWVGARLEVDIRSEVKLPKILRRKGESANAP